MGTEFLKDLLADGLSSEEAAAQVERSRSRILEAPLAVLLCQDESEMDHYPDERRQNAEHIMAVQGVGMAGQNLLLAAHAEGLGSVWMCAPLFVPEVVQKSLGLPESWRPQGLVLLGYPASVVPVRPRLSIEEVSVNIE
jgi:F420 biosynthesis protein FbiB-like protein